MDPYDIPRRPKKHELDSEHSRKLVDEDSLSTRGPPPLPAMSPTMATSSVVEATVEATDLSSVYRKPPFTGLPPLPFAPRPTEFPPGLIPTTSSIASSWTTKTKDAAYSEHQRLSMIPETQSSQTTLSAPTTSGVADDSGGYGSPGWHGPARHQNNGPLYAAAAIIPIAVLAIIAFAVFLCRRKRKRAQQEKSATSMTGQQTKMSRGTHSPPTMHPYIAPTPIPTPRYSPRGHENLTPPTSVQTQPIILGPIPSGVNGAYLTGIDTSDVVSVTSASNLRPGPDPFADNSSLSEPPPPYRPRSAAPPSFTTNSRQSSLRASAPPASSQTHLMAHSPFDHPDDDAVSVMSGPARGRGEDAMSEVSDLSYQRDPVMYRSPL